MQPLLLRLLAITLAASPLSAQTDTTAPSVPVNLAGTAASSTTIVLYWTQANDDVGVSAYEIERDGTHLVTHADNTLLDTGLIPGTTHTYKVAARDAAGNLSAYSNPVVVSTDSAENPRLVRSGHLTYLGAFTFPRDERNDYAYGGTSIGYNPINNSLFARGHDWYQLVGEISIPTPLITTDFSALPVATVLQDQTDITEGHMNEVGADGATMSGCKIGGLLVYDGRLIGTSYVYYDAGGTARRSHFTSGLDFSVTGDFNGMFAVGSRNPGFVAGHMAHIPPAWQEALGGTVLTGLDGVPIVSRTSYGPTVTAFDPDDLGVVTPVPARLLVGYTYEHSTLGTWGNSSEYNPQFNQATGSSGIVFPFGSDSVLFFGSAGIGIPCYGQGTSDPSLDRTPVPGTDGHVVYVYDPASNGKGCHAYPYAAYVWAYRASDLARVAAGQLQYWQAVPYATWELPMPFGTDGEDSPAGAAYDPATGRIYVCQYNAVGASPIIHVYRIEFPQGDDYAAWRAANFSGPDHLDDAISGPLADPDASGVSNLQRYAFDLPARGPALLPIESDIVTVGGTSHLTITFTRRTSASDISYIVEQSADLDTWTAVPGLSYSAGTPASVTAQDPVAIADVTTSCRFLRLRVSTSQ